MYRLFKSLLFISFVCLIAISSSKDETDPAKCTHTVEKSAVTEEAAKEAAKALKKPPIFSNEVYSSKVKILKPAPYFSGKAVFNGEFTDIKLTDYSGKYLVLLFYPLDFTFVCPTEIVAFSDKAEEFRRNLNTEIVAISTDSPFTHLAWTKTPRKQGGLGHVNIPLLSDLTHQISKDYGVYLEHLGHSLRGLFIIDGKGIVRQITMNDLPVGRSVEETIRLVQAFQYADSHGEVCPAGWKPGQATIIPNPTESLKYFSKVKDEV